MKLNISEVNVRYKKIQVQDTLRNRVIRKDKNV